MLWWSCWAVNVTGGGAERLCAHAQGQTASRPTKQMADTEDRNESDMETLHNEISNHTEKSDLLKAIHGIPSLMSLAPKFSAIIGLIWVAAGIWAQSVIQTPAKAESWVTSWGAS